MKPLQHAQISARTHGGSWTDYVEVHSFLDSSKAACAHFRHRFLLHHAEGIKLGVKIFGETIRNGEGQEVPTRKILTEHLIEDVGRVVTVEDWMQDLLPNSNSPFYKLLAEKRNQIEADAVSSERELLSDALVAQLKSVDELLEINRRTPKRIGEHLPATLNGLYALAFAIATSVTESNAVEMLELINRFDEQRGEKFALLPMRDLQTMAGSLLLDKIWKEGWKVEHSEAFWRYNEKRESADSNQNSAESENSTASETAIPNAARVGAVAVATV